MDRQHLRPSERRLENASLAHTPVVDPGEEKDRAHRHGAGSEVSEGNEVPRVAGKDHGDGRDDTGVHGPEHCPAPEKAQGRRVRFPKEDIDAPRGGKGRCQLGAHQRAEEREATGNSPYQEDPRHGRHLPRDLGGLHEDRRPDDRAHDHGGGVVEADHAIELRS